MSSLRLSVLAVLAATSVGIGSAAACTTADLAGEWAATYSHGAPGYCTLTLDDTGAVTASACWIEHLEANPKFVLTGAFTVDEATCQVTAALTAAEPTPNQHAFASAAKAAKAAMKNKGKGKGGKGGHGGGMKDVNLAGRLLTGAELINGLLVRPNGEFSPVSLTRSK